MTASFGLYVVMTEPIAGYEACAEAAVLHGVRYLQLRMKDAAREAIIRVGHRLRAVTKGSATRFIVNDDLVVARAVDADGLHLGQADMALAEARQLWPSDEPKIFGLSTHDEAQAQAAEAQSPDYIGVGPLYATPTKSIADPVVGVARAASIVRQSRLPCVAIGGIDARRLPEVLAEGLHNFAVVRYVCQHPRPSEPIGELVRLWSEWQRRSRLGPAGRLRN